MKTVINVTIEAIEANEPVRLILENAESRETTVFQVDASTLQTLREILDGAREAREIMYDALRRQ